MARDIAHAKIKERLDAGEPMPQYLRDHAVYYAGPAKTPAGYASGSFGPTTAGRMDSYVDQFQAAGGSMVMLAKGNRSQQVTRACNDHGGFYLGSIGGPAARLAQDCIKHVEVVEYAELGMEAVWKIEVEDFPAFIVVDDKGNDFFAETAKPVAVDDPDAVGRELTMPAPPRLGVAVGVVARAESERGEVVLRRRVEDGAAGAAGQRRLRDGRPRDVDRAAARAYDGRGVDLEPGRHRVPGGWWSAVWDSATRWPSC